MRRSGLMVLVVLLALLTGAAVSPAAAADSDRLGFSAGAAGGGGGLRQWADEYLNLFSGDGGRTDQRRPSCRGRECPSGMQCCCCGDRCYCKEECSFQPCAEPGLPGR